MVYNQTPRSEKIRAAARSRILRSARELFAEHGYDRTTMAEIVRGAKTSIGNSYFYFSNKEDLLTSLMEEATREAWARADEVIRSVAPGAPRIAVAMYANIMSFFTSDRDLAQIAVTAEPRVIRHILGLNARRLLDLLAVNFPDRSEKDHMMTAVAVGGANRTAIDLFLTGHLDTDPRELTDFLIKWHLRAFGLPNREMSRVLRICARTIKPMPANKRPARHQALRKNGSGVQRA